MYFLHITRYINHLRGYKGFRFSKNWFFFS